MAQAGATEERFYEAELYRLKGELLLTQESQRSKASPEPARRGKGQMLVLSGVEGSKVEEAEACFHTAVEVARRQKAKSWELRASTSLARLWQLQGKTTEARELLTPVYGWFTEGFDTADLLEAKALLKELD